MLPDQRIVPRNGKVAAAARSEIIVCRDAMASTTRNLHKTVYCRHTQRRLVYAYLRLYLVPAGGDGAKTVRLARFGAYEVRLFEFAQELSVELPPLFIELYDHSTRSSLDSCGCHDLDDAVSCADALIAQAEDLDGDSERN